MTILKALHRAKAPLIAIAAAICLLDAIYSAFVFENSLLKDGAFHSALLFMILYSQVKKSVPVKQ